MTAPRRIRLRRTNGWRKPPGAVVVARPSLWGNPFRVGEVAAHRHRSAAHPHDFYVDRHRIVDAAQAVALYRRIITEPAEHQYVGHDTPTIHAIRANLAGRDLACWCPLVDEDGNPVPCHGDVLLELANSRESAP